LKKHWLGLHGAHLECVKIPDNPCRGLARKPFPGRAFAAIARNARRIEGMQSNR
jgi:hypothetical protein